MKKYLVLFFGLFLIFISMSNVFSFAGGSGTQEDPYQISTWEELQNISSNPDSSYVLLNDLNSSTDGYGVYASKDANAGKGWIPLGNDSNKFNGTFNGQNHTIADLFINRPNTDYVGLFGYASENTNFSNINVKDFNITGYQNVGGLIGRGEGDVYNSFSKGNITGERYYTGGLMGYSSGTVKNSFSKANVLGKDNNVGGLIGYTSGIVENCFSTGNVTGESYSTGGLIGHSGGNVNGCFSKANVTGNNRVGGLIGYSDENTYDSFSIGIVSGSSSVGGLIGDNRGNVENCFWDVETSGKASSDGGTGVSTVEMKDRIIYEFGGWNISPSNNDLNNGYPYLGWQANNNSFTWFIQENDTLFAGGNGSLENPYQINDFKQLRNINLELDANYTLISDLNKSSDYYDVYASPNTGAEKGWFSIGDSSYIFTGSFKGQNHTIADLFINRPNTDYVGLFGNVGNNVNISN
ncbi:MAG TPA: GLUG motif-containing protein, partial [Candidatus Nanoarchaeia archaeon]|nr:GLUG motif-containing protein [Candidatus Nanoarchaeia archaeon]